MKSVSKSLENFHTVLKDQTVTESLNEKLAEYAFFPLTHIFNESQKLSSRCLELAVLSLQILVVDGWREKLSPEMGKQLLLLLTLLASGSPGKTNAEVPTEDLKIAAFNCIETVVTWLGASQQSKSLFDDVGTKNIVDQIAFLLLEAISEDESDKVQLAASKALLQVNKQISNRVVLASLLPRTVSTLTKVLRPSTQQRRTYKVLASNLDLLRITLQRVLNDRVALAEPKNIGPIATTATDKDLDDSPGVLDQSWLKATSAQVKIALTHVTQLRKHDRVEVRESLAHLCTMVLEECSQSLAECASVMLETLVSLVNEEDMQDVSSGLKYLLTTTPSLIEDLKSSLQKWMASLSRLMQASDDRPRQRALTQISQAVQLLSSLGQTSGIIQQTLPTILIDSVMSAMQPNPQKMIAAVSEPASSISQLLTTRIDDTQDPLQTIVLGQKSQQGSLLELRAMVGRLAALEQGPSITRAIIDTIPVAEGNQQLAAIWLALQLLTGMPPDAIDDFLISSHESSDLSTTKPFLISDLYSYTLPLLLCSADTDPPTQWQAFALALSSLTLQATQLGRTYRPELLDTLYPVLSLLSSPIAPLQSHTMKTLNLLASSLAYDSVSALLTANADYLINSAALQLNSANLSPSAPQVLLMLVRLCGATLLPYLDDVIGSIFAALDDFHGYPLLVEGLFEVLGAVVDESAKQPVLSITEGKQRPQHRKAGQEVSGIGDILGDLAGRVNRKHNLDEEDEQIGSAPKRPWSNELDGPVGAKEVSSEDTLQEEENEMMPAANPSSSEEETPLSKSHQLLLRIAQATTPHLSSPSPKVRHTLLNLLDRITPLLARDENSFLPLINAIWPSLTERLFAEIAADGDGEAAFNVCAAADTISKLCEGAGDFIGNRIEDVFARLVGLWRRTWSKVEGKRTRRSKISSNEVRGGNLAAGVDLRVVKAGAGDVERPRAAMAQLSIGGRTTDAQVLNSLVTLLVAVLTFVRIPDDNGDTILELLAPVMDEPGRESVREALENWNADAVWLVRERRLIEQEMMSSLRHMDDWSWRPAEGTSGLDQVYPSFLAEVVF